MHPNEHLDVHGHARAYRLVVPDKALGSRAVPLVFAFHGMRDSKDKMAAYSGLDALAEKHGFVLVYPNARRKFWPLLLPHAQNDLEFFDALYDKITSEYPINLNRVYLIGMSNGGYFCHFLASLRADKIAAIAAHSAGLGTLGALESPPEVSRKYAVLAIHGDRDHIVPVDEGRRTHEAYKKWGHSASYVEVRGLKHGWAALANINTQIWKFFVAHPKA